MARVMRGVSSVGRVLPNSLRRGISVSLILLYEEVRQARLT